VRRGAENNPHPAHPGNATVTQVNPGVAVAATASGAASTERVLLRRDEVAKLLSIGLTTLDAWRQSGRIPPPTLITDDVAGRARIVLWAREDIERWAREGCPWAGQGRRKRCAR